MDFQDRLLKLSVHVTLKHVLAHNEKVQSRAPPQLVEDEASGRCHGELIVERLLVFPLLLT